MRLLQLIDELIPGDVRLEIVPTVVSADRDSERRTAGSAAGTDDGRASSAASSSVVTRNSNTDGTVKNLRREHVGRLVDIYRPDDP